VGGRPVPELAPGTDRFVDIALLRRPQAGRLDLAGLLSWDDNGVSPPVPYPVGNADITATAIVTALIAGEHDETPTGDPKVELLEEILTTQKSVLAPSKATWDEWAGKGQILGSTTLTFTNATGFNDASVDIIVNGDGSQTFTNESELSIDTTGTTFDVTLSPAGPGNLVGRVEVTTGDPRDVNVTLESTSSLDGSPIEHTGVSYNVSAAAGSWETAVNIPANHRALTPDTQTQFVPAGGQSEEAVFELLELGLVDMSVSGPTAGVKYVVDESSPVSLDDFPQILGLAVDENGTTTELRTIRLTQLPPGSVGAGPGVDLKRATVTVTKESADDTPADAQLPDAETVDLKAGLSLPFAAGTKYNVGVTLREYGKLTGTLVGTSAEIGRVNICATGTQATITATPTKIGLVGPDTDEANGGRPVLTTSSCGGDFTLAGEEGTYNLSVKHPEFEDPSDQVVTMPAADGTTPLLSNPTLTILQSHLTVAAVDLSDQPIDSSTEFIYYALDTINADGGAESGEPTRMVGGMAVSDLVDPSEMYMLTVRSCPTALPEPNLREMFDLCVNRFPATVPLAVPRSTDDPPPAVTMSATAEVTLLQVGGKIDLAISFVNAAGREVCPTPNSDLEFVRDFDRSQFPQATVNDVVVDIPNVNSESVEISCTTVAPAIIGTVDNVRFELLVASGQHVIGLPKIGSFVPPTVTGGDVSTAEIVGALGLFPEVNLDDFYFFSINYAPSSWAEPMTFPVQYVAKTVDAEFFICGLGSCSEEFPDLAVELISPAGGRYPATFGSITPDGYPISAAGLEPEIEGYIVSIEDSLHDNYPSERLMVTAGTEDPPPPTQTITFPGSFVRVAINPQETYADPGGRVRDLCSIDPDRDCPPGTGTVKLEGKITGEAWVLIKENAWEICAVSTRDYQYCDSAVSGDYDELRAVVTQTGYIDGVFEMDSPGAGGSVVLEPNLEKRAIVRIKATARDQLGDISFPESLIESVKLVREDGVQSPYADPVSGRLRTVLEDRLASTINCANSGSEACFDFYADSGFKFRGRADTSPSTRYLVAQSVLTEKTTKIGQVAETKTTVSITFEPAPPGAPTSVVASAGVSEATVSWTAPSSFGFSVITDYRVTAVPGAGGASGSCPWTTGDGALECDVTGLTPGVAYTFTVTATNAAGTGGASAASDPAVTPYELPGAPRSVVASAGVSEATVSWTAPSSNGFSVITDYRVTAVPGAGGAPGSCPWTTGDGALECDVTGLTPGVAYTFTVTATNAAGTGGASVASDPAVTPTSS
jgi:hypothetical protein